MKQGCTVMKFLKSFGVGQVFAPQSGKGTTSPGLLQASDLMKLGLSRR